MNANKIKTLLLIVGFIFCFAYDLEADVNQAPYIPTDPLLKTQDCYNNLSQELCDTIPDTGQDGSADASWFIIAPTWMGGDPNGDPVTYKIYLKAGECTSSSPITFGPEDLSLTLDEPSTGSPERITTVEHIFGTENFQNFVLDFCTCYYWKVVATDNRGATTEGPVWKVRTRGIKITAPNRGDSEAIVIGEKYSITWRLCSDLRYPYSPEDEVKILLSTYSIIPPGSCGYRPEFKEIGRGKAKDLKFEWDTKGFTPSDDCFIAIVTLKDGKENGSYGSGVFSMVEQSIPPTTTTSIPPLPPECNVSVSPETAEVNLGGTVEFDAETVCDEFTIKYGRTYIWEIDPPSSIGSTITVTNTDNSSFSALYQAGSNTICEPIAETIKVTDKVKRISATAVVTVTPPVCEVTIDQGVPATVESGTTIQLSAVTECNDIEAASEYLWEINSSIGSSIDETGLYTAGHTQLESTDTITVSDLLNCNVFSSVQITVTPEIIPPPPTVFEVTITPADKIVASGGEISFNAVTTSPSPSSAGKVEPTPPDYEWSVESLIGSQIDASTGAYSAGENTIGHQVTDTITVVDHANNDATASSEVLVTYGKITFIFPPTILASRWIPLPFTGFLVGENLNTNIFSTILRFEPASDILPISQIVFGDFVMFMVLVNPNPITDAVDIIVDTNGELAVANNMPLTIGLLPWILDEANRGETN